jgi:hypothetical protein
MSKLQRVSVVRPVQISNPEQLNFDNFTDVWLIVVELDEGLRVGYWSHDAY